VISAAPVVALVAALVAGPASSASTTNPTRTAAHTVAAYAPHQLLVRFQPEVGGADIRAVNARFGATTLKSFHIVPGLQLLGLPASASVTAAVAAYRGLQQVKYAQPNWIVRLDGPIHPQAVDKTPNDPMYPQQWDWPKVGAPAAWDQTVGSKNVIVGDIDSGIDLGHEDLAANIWKNTDECGGQAGVDDDANGYVDDCHGIDTINGDVNPTDDTGHGTHTAGTIGAVGNNGKGVTGFNWKIQVLPCKSHGSDGNGTPASIIECYQYMVDERADGYDIIATNNSYGGCVEACDFDQATIDGISAMNDAGILFAVSAGNDAHDNDVIPKYPTNYFLPNIISTAATSSTDTLASFSNYGDRTVMLGAPGVSVLSTIPGSYGFNSGTSMAAPHVAGLAGLLHAWDPGLSIYEIRNLILSGGDPIATLDGKSVTGKRLNANGSMTCTNKKVFGLLRPLDNVTRSKQTVAALNIKCAAGAGTLTVTIKPGNIKLKLKDGGLKGDLQANDGIYSASWKPAAKGTFTLTFSNGKSYTVVVG
jgi:subtilisin family serine protease